MPRHHFDLCAAELSNRPILLMEEERHRLARDLHDDLLQILTALGLRLDLCRQLSNNNDHAALGVELARLRGCGERILDAMRAWDAGPSGCASCDGSLSEAIGCLAGLCREQTGIGASLNRARLPERLPGSGQSGPALPEPTPSVAECPLARVRVECANLGRQ